MKQQCIKQESKNNKMNKQSNKIHYNMQTARLRLVPYSRRYVQQYHEWFSKYPQLLHLTGSQPLTLQEEIQNHKTWLDDKTKYTFLVFLKENNKMIGDVNLFFSEWIEENEAEINIMIAIPQARGKGLAKQIMAAIELFSVGVYERGHIIAKIKDDNTSSIAFFKKIGYQFVQHNHHHGQMEFHKQLQKNKIEAKHELIEVYKLRQQHDVMSLY